jgi:hypothetical protein
MSVFERERGNCKAAIPPPISRQNLTFWGYGGRIRGREIKGRINWFADGGIGTHSLRSNSLGEFICLIFPSLASPYVSTSEQESLRTSDLKTNFSSLL